MSLSRVIHIAYTIQRQEAGMSMQAREDGNNMDCMCVSINGSSQAVDGRERDAVSMMWAFI